MNVAGVMEIPRLELKDMHDAVCVVTGANLGLGEATAAELARLGAHAVVCRKMTGLTGTSGEARL